MTAAAARRVRRTTNARDTLLLLTETSDLID
jgi:hypothetical protein